MSFHIMIPHIGYAMIFLLVLGESAGIPIPGETALLLGSAIAGAGSGLSIYRVAAFGAAAAFLGDNAGYWIGRKHGERIIALLQRRFKFSNSLLVKGETFYEHYGFESVIAGRFVAFLRVLTPVYAGIARMNPVEFLIADLIGGVLWVATICFLGHAFGSNIQALERLIKHMRWIVLAAFMAAALAIVLRKRLRRS